ncbi:MAG: hypothetical protein IKR11_10675 [Solobacterium sp.]|nr:hypothetical protein [Solobacterium sp.]
MIVYDETRPGKEDPDLVSLLKRRRNPLLSETGLRKVLEELTMKMSENILLYACAYPRENVRNLKEITAADWEKTDIVLGSDNEKYLPVFTTVEKLHAFFPSLNPEAVIYMLNKKDILTYLNLNENTAAAVVNPTVDDLLLYRVNLTNLIQVEQDMYSRN